MIIGRVALLGDAAFVARPHVGMGTTKAAGDARALADHLARHDDIDAALAAYDAEAIYTNTICLIESCPSAREARGNPRANGPEGVTGFGA